jgi:hypothetical protein
MRKAQLRVVRPLQEKYSLLGTIGEGTYGIVFKAVRRTSSKGEGEPKAFAIKCVKSHKEGANHVSRLKNHMGTHNFPLSYVPCAPSLASLKGYPVNVHLAGDQAAA